MNDALREYERKLDQTELERQDIEKELKRIRDSYEREKAHREHLEGEYEECTATIGELESRITKLLEDNGRLKLHLARAETNIEDEKARTKRQNDTIMELQKIISEFNERTTRFDANMLEEKNIRRKVERDRERVEDELKHSQEHNIKLQQKIDLLKEECRRKDSVISRLEKKLEDKEAMMNDCVKELKDLHKAKVNELEEKMADYKRRNSKLESENNMQKIKLETTFERESSVDSDYVEIINQLLFYFTSNIGRSSSGRLSTVGRQYSLTSVSSFSSMRTLSRRRETEPDLSSSMYLTRQIRTFTVNNDNLTQQLDKAEKNADGLALRLKKVQADADLWKKKHEEAVIESQNEILLERKRTVERLEATKHEKNLRLSKLTSLEHANDDLRSELIKTQAELDRAIATIQGLESNVQSQVLFRIIY
uniref:Myosin_tail_1 domain-containing protein n=1 Tax=Heterorhabditis bacteriophora TaxID=37862 RepID=A0A1I7XIE6_HETBA